MPDIVNPHESFDNYSPLEYIMGNEIMQFSATEDKCVYFYNERFKRYQKICDVMTFNELPTSVKRQIRAAKEEAAEVLRMPTE
jgi:hypothetical protein